MDLHQLAADAEDLRDTIEAGPAYVHEVANALIVWAGLSDEPMPYDAALDMADTLAQQARDDARAGEDQ
ncbi:MAG TPA: hypothetical protein VK586_03620 [Streptosporangiaceae bacterium]|nr:hypothetical protein [Streptosporangiaceae bacterium]